MANPTLRFKRGTQSAFASVGLQTGEPAFITDESNFYIGVDGTTTNNKFFGSSRYWSKETASKGSGVNLVEANTGSDFITLAAPASVGAAITYYFPATQGLQSSVLTNDGNGNLSWGSGSSNAVFTGITTINGTFFDVNVNSDFSGITTFSNTTDSTTKDTGSVVIEGGIGIEKSLNVGGNLKVSGVSTFVGNVTFEGGTITLGDTNADNVVFAADVNSNILPNTDATYDIGDASASKRWRHASFSGVVTAGTLSGSLSNTLTLNTSGTGLSGSTTFNNSGAATFTVTSNATSANTGGAIVSRDSSGNFIAGIITATTFVGNLTGTATTASTVAANSVGLGTDTYGSYVKDITGTSNQITVTSGTGEGSSPTLSIPNQFTAPQDVEVTRDLQVNRNLNVNGNITIGGTSATLFSQSLNIFDPDIVLGFRTDALGNDVSNDNTANHGGVALASTEGTPLVQLFIAGIETNPATYKKIMWFKAGEFAGLGTDAWLINYAVGIGSTQFPSGTRLAAGAVQFTERDLSVVRNINASGIVTAGTFSGQLNVGVSTFTGITTVTGATLFTTQFSSSGISSVTNTTDNTLGTTNTGALQVAGGVAVAKNLTVGAGLSVVGNSYVNGISTFVGNVTFQGGTINLGDTDIDNVVFAADVNSNILPNTDATFDIGDASATKRWRHASFSGVGTFATGAVVDAVQIGISATNEIDTSAGILILDSAGGQVDIQDHLAVSGVSTFTGAVNSSGQLNVNNDLRVGAGLSVVGVSTFTGAVNSNGQLNVNNDLRVGAGLSVVGVSTFTGAVNSNGTLNVNNSVRVGAGLSVVGVSTFTALTTFNNGITVNNAEATFSSATVSDLTSGRVVLAGASGSLVDDSSLTFSDAAGLTVANSGINITGISTFSTDLTVGGSITVNGNAIKSSTGNTAITLSDNSITVNGDLYVSGSTTQVNTATLSIEDQLIELGKVDGSAPGADLNKDVGLLLHYYDTAARLGSVFWDDSVSRIVLASRVSETLGVLAVDSGYYADVEFKGLYITDTAGTAEAVISYTTIGGVTGRHLQNIIVDGGTF